MVDYEKQHSGHSPLFGVVWFDWKVPEDGSRFPAAETSKSKCHLFFAQTMANVRNVVSQQENINYFPIRDR